MTQVNIQSSLWGRHYDFHVRSFLSVTLLSYCLSEETEARMGNSLAT